MGKKDEVSPDLYVAAYGDASVAEEDWNGLKQLADDDLLEIEALARSIATPTARFTSRTPPKKRARAPRSAPWGGALVDLIFSTVAARHRRDPHHLRPT